MKHSFLIITTNNLPEAWFIADFLLRREQQVFVVNKRGRTGREKRRVFRRLLSRRGPVYLADMLLGKLLKSAYVRPEVVPFPEIDAGRIGQLRKQVDYYECDDVHSQESIGHIKAGAPDYILVAGAPVLRPSVFSLSRHLTLNRHQGLSPADRGSDCPIWLLAEGRARDLGYTIHSVCERVDGGAVIQQKRLALPDGLDFSAALAYINRQASIGYTDVLGQIIEGRLPQPGMQESSGGRHYPPATLTAIRRAHRNYRTLAAACRQAEA
jgi:folate-dependent phosphoribosylglycinamide formyltransferase PurN